MARRFWLIDDGRTATPDADSRDSVSGSSLGDENQASNGTGLVEEADSLAPQAAIEGDPPSEGDPGDDGPYSGIGSDTLIGGTEADEPIGEARSDMEDGSGSSASVSMDPLGDESDFGDAAEDRLSDTGTPTGSTRDGVPKSDATPQGIGGAVVLQEGTAAGPALDLTTPDLPALDLPDTGVAAGDTDGPVEAPGVGRIFYVDQVNGSDANAGTATGSAWKSLAKVNAADLQPGDSVLFNRGDTWTGEVKLTDSGSADQPIVFGAYGSGADPVITGATSGISGTGVNNIVIEDLTIRNMTAAAIYAKNAANWTIRDVMLDTAGDGLAGGGVNWWYGSDLTIERTTLNNIHGDGIWAWEVDGLRLIDNTVHTVHGKNADNVHLYRADNYEIQGNYFELADNTDSDKGNFHSYAGRNGVISQNIFIGGNYGIDIADDSVTVKLNSIFGHNKESWSSGIIVGEDVGTEYNTYINNYIKDARIGMYVYSEELRENFQITNNIIDAPLERGAVFESPMSGAFKNNEIWSQKSPGDYISSYGDIVSGQTWTVEDNILSRLGYESDGNRVRGGTGDDTLRGGAQSDILVGDAGDDTLIGGGGRDHFDGGEGIDTVDYTGTAHALEIDLVRGSTWVAEILAFEEKMTRIENMKGGNGADTIRGDSGKNVLAGGPGNDRFIFGDGAGTDTVLDFVGGAEATDRLDLSENTFLDSFADVLANARQVGADTIIDLGGDDHVTLTGVGRLALQQDDFVF